MDRAFVPPPFRFRLGAAHKRRPAGQPHEHDSRLPVPVLGVTLGVPAEALKVPPEGVPGPDLPPVDSNHAHGEDDEGEARHEGYLAAFLVFVHQGDCRPGGREAADSGTLSWHKSRRMVKG